MPPVIQFDHVSKFYPLRHERARSFQESFVRLLRRKDLVLSDVEPFWALKDVSFDIGLGDVIGFVGSNGAGKSTLLKLIARVLRPTTGRVWARGKVAPLLSVGAGFHPELTGRENIFLNGTLLGFTQKEMRRKFDSIVEFSELGEFIDLPVRSYSSGMAARLGFAVASDSRPDILIVDEALAVGDEAFQAKCFQRIETYQAEGMTTFLVTHNSGLLRKYCQRAAWLHKGELKLVSEAKEVLDHYRETFTPPEAKHPLEPLFGV